MPERMSAQIEQAGARAAAASPPEGPATDGNGAPVPQVVAAPGIDAASPIVRTEVIPSAAGEMGETKAPPGAGGVGSGKRDGSKLVIAGYALVVVGFLLVFVV